jgi:hypothetical protein
MRQETDYVKHHIREGCGILNFQYFTDLKDKIKYSTSKLQPLDNPQNLDQLIDSVLKNMALPNLIINCLMNGSAIKIDLLKTQLDKHSIRNTKREVDRFFEVEIIDEEFFYRHMRKKHHVPNGWFQHQLAINGTLMLIIEKKNTKGEVPVQQKNLGQMLSTLLSQIEKAGINIWYNCLKLY